MRPIPADFNRLGMLRISGLLTIACTSIALIGCVYLAIVISLGATIQIDEITKSVLDPYHMVRVTNAVAVAITGTLVCCPIWLYARIKRVAERPIDE